MWFEFALELLAITWDPNLTASSTSSTRIGISGFSWSWMVAIPGFVAPEKNIKKLVYSAQSTLGAVSKNL